MIPINVLDHHNSIRFDQLEIICGILLRYDIPKTSNMYKELLRVKNRLISCGHKLKSFHSKIEKSNDYREKYELTMDYLSVFDSVLELEYRIHELKRLIQN